MNEFQPPVSHLKSLGEGTSTEYQTEGGSISLLEWFENPNKERDLGQSQGLMSIHIEFPEFTSMCPKTGQPDFANIAIDYIPRERCVESKSLKLYFISYRNEGAFMEAITQKIASDLIQVLNPFCLMVKGEFAPRGGMPLHPTVVFYADDYEGNEF